MLTEGQQSPWSDSSPFAHQALLTSDRDSMKLGSLREKNDELNTKVRSLMAELEYKREMTRTYYNFSMLTTVGDVSFSRWTFPDHLLLDYNRGFLELSQRDPSELQVRKFSCAQLYHKKHLVSCASVIYLLANGLVDHIEMNQEWWIGGEGVPVKSYLTLQFSETQVPKEVVLFSKRSTFTFASETLFQPIDFALSRKAKDEGFDLRKYFSMYNFIPDCLRLPGDPPNPPCPEKKQHAEDVSYTSPPPVNSPARAPVHEHVCPESSYSHSPPGLAQTPSPLSLEELLTMSPRHHEEMGRGESPSLSSDMDTLLSSSTSGGLNLMNEFDIQDQGLESALRDILGEQPMPNAYFSYPDPPRSRASLTDSTNFLDGR